MHMMRGIMMVQILICLLKISHNAKTETTIYLVACRITMKIHVRTPSSSCHGEGHGVPSGLAHSENLCFFYISRSAISLPKFGSEPSSKSHHTIKLREKHYR